MSDKINISKVSEDYILETLSNSEIMASIGVKIHIDGGAKRLTITNAKGRKEFIFDESVPAVVERIGALLIKASEMTQDKVDLPF